MATHPSRRPVRRPRHCAGFTLLELSISLLLTVVLIVGALEIFNFSNKLSRVQMQVTEVQQGLRVGQRELLRPVQMAGLGGLPGGVWPRGTALQVLNNVPVSTKIAPTALLSPAVVAGTDVLVVRGVFSTPLYEIRYKIPGHFTLNDADNLANPTPNPAVSETGSVHVCALSPSGLLDQDLTPLRELIAAGSANTDEAMVMVSPVDDTLYAVVELEVANSLATSTLCDLADPNAGVTLGFRVVSEDVTVPHPDQRSDLYRRLSPAPPNENLQQNLTAVASLGIVEEYRYYLRDETSDSLPAPRLSRAQVFPNTDVAYRGSAANLSADVVDNVIDLQVALGIDQSGDSLVRDTADETDEWLYNHAADDDTVTGNWGSRPVKYLRLTTIVRTDRPDPQFLAPLMVRTENHDYTAGDFPNTALGRKYRRRQVQTMVDLRNLG